MKFASLNLTNASQIAKCEPLIRTFIKLEVLYNIQSCSSNKPVNTVGAVMLRHLLAELFRISPQR